MKRLAMILVPVLILLVGIVGAYAMFKARPAPPTSKPEVRPPLVRTVPAAVEDVRLVVRSQGTVRPRTESVLVPEVAGRVIDVAPSFAAGGFFDKGAALLTIEPYDYREAVVQAEAAVAAAELRLAREQAEAEVAVKEWNELEGGEAPPLTRRQPQLAEARASLEAAKAALDRARRNLERTRVRAPFTGRVRDKRVDVGQYVAPGTALATIYAVDYVEVSLPIPDGDLAYLDLPLHYRGEARKAGPEVTLTADFAGRRHEWTGRIVRTEGVIDPKTRMINVVARVADPYGRGASPDRPPLAVGMYVQAEIQGIRVEEAVVIPRAALRDDGRVLIVDDEQRLRLREVGLLRSTGRRAILISGVEPGEQVCVSPLAVVTDGMPVRVETASEAGS